MPEGHTDTPQLKKTPQLLAEYIQYKNISQNMYRPQPCAQRAHRHPPTEQNPTIVGRIYPIQTHIRSEVVGAGTDASRTVYFKKETNNGETNNVEMLCCNHKVHHFKTSRILNNSSKNI